MPSKVETLCTGQERQNNKILRATEVLVGKDGFDSQSQHCSTQMARGAKPTFMPVWLSWLEQRICNPHVVSSNLTTGSSARETAHSPMGWNGSAIG